jgi:DNA polymerase III alpha subunit
MIGWLVSRKMTQTQKGDPMEFVTFEDLTGIYETTFFPATYRRFYPTLSGGRPYLLRGRVEEEFGAVTLNVRHVDRLDIRRAAAILKADSSSGGSHDFQTHQANQVGGRLPSSEEKPPRASGKFPASTLY